jgi:hypothetical protein
MPILYDVAAKYKHNLSVETNAANPAYQVDVNADELALISPAGQKLVLEGVNETIDIEVAGLGGLDEGSEGSTTIYYLWIISNGTLVSGLVSLSSTAPTMPGIYTYKRLVGEVYNDGSGDFVEFLRYDDWNCFKVPYEVATAITVTATRVESAMSGIVPAGCTKIDLAIACVDAEIPSMCITEQDSAVWEQIFMAAPGEGSPDPENSLSKNSMVRQIIPWRGGTSIWYKRAHDANIPGHTVYVYGYKLAR